MESVHKLAFDCDWYADDLYVNSWWMVCNNTLWNINQFMHSKKPVINSIRNLFLSSCYRCYWCTFAQTLLVQFGAYFCTADLTSRVWAFVHLVATVQHLCIVCVQLVHNKLHRANLLLNFFVHVIYAVNKPFNFATYIIHCNAHSYDASVEMCCRNTSRLYMHSLKWK